MASIIDGVLRLKVQYAACHDYVMRQRAGGLL